MLRDLGFVLIATLVVGAFGLVAIHGPLPIERELSGVPLAHDDREFMRWWFRIAGGVGLVLPLVTFILGFRSHRVRSTFGRYLWVLAIQIATEATFRRLFFSTIVIVIGTIYTAYRVCVLGSAWKQLGEIEPSRTSGDGLRRLVLFLIALWSVNLLVLLSLRWPGLW